MNGHFLFASDLDGTLLPNGEKRAPAHCLQHTWSLLKLLREQHNPIVYSSGRYLELAKRGQKAFRLISPDYWICNVGTEIYNSHGIRDSDWETYLGEPIKQAHIIRALMDVPDLMEQESSRQGPHKFSFYYPEKMPQDLCQYVDDTIMRIYPQGKVVRSIEESSGRCLIDIVPSLAGKANALDYLARKLGFNQQQVCFAGDSGNDIDALIHGFSGVLVGNAPEDVRQRLALALKEKPEGHCYVSDAFYGNGIIEGLNHYGFLKGEMETLNLS